MNSIFFFLKKVNVYISGKRLGEDWGRLPVKYYVYIETKHRKGYVGCSVGHCIVKDRKCR